VKRIIAKRTIREFWENFPDSKDYLETWYETVKGAEWKTPNDIKQFYATVSILKSSRVVFNIKGNDYRLVAKINYEKQWLFIRFIGTHKEYDKIDADNI
jgi:mRNA interferase HigB